MNKSINSDIDLSDLLNYSKKYFFLYLSSIIVISLFFIRVPSHLTFNLPGDTLDLKLQIVVLLFFTL
jgi:hypothetical protein